MLRSTSRALRQRGVVARLPVGNGILPFSSAFDSFLNIADAQYISSPKLQGTDPRAHVLKNGWANSTA